MLGRWRHGLLLSALWVGSGCPPSPSAPDAGLPPAQARAGIKLPLPSGWTAAVGEDRSFRVGPLGRPVLRIDLRVGEGAALPDAPRLEALLLQASGEPQLSVEQTREETDFSMLLYRASPLPSPAEGGPRRKAPLALLAAKQAGADLFLCASLPGASEAEVQLAAQTCEKLTPTPLP